MKSVLGLFGLAVLSLSCSSNGDALFDSVGGQPSGGTAASGGAGAGSNGGNSGNGGAAATNAGGSSNNGGSGAMSNGGGNSGGSGTAGTAGSEASGGDGMGGSGPSEPEVIYVATSGTDSADCGLTQSTPCKSISLGVARSVEASRSDVYVQAGKYAGVVVLKAGVHVLGGFDDSWQSGPRTDAAHQVTIQGALDPDSQEYLAVWAHDLTTQASLENLQIVAPDAEGQKAGTLNGRSSYGVHAVSAKLLLKGVDIQAGKGAKGADGSNGQDAVSTAAVDAMNGGVGGAAVSTLVGCSIEASAGGPAGVNSCSESPSTVDMTGGKGGDGGARDTKCTPANQTWTWDYTALPGQAGADASLVSGQSGKGGGPGSGGGPPSPQNGACGPTEPGHAGMVANGSAGAKAPSGGKLAGDFWYALPGGDGGTGQNGGGGGGGGGSGGCDANLLGTTDVRGAGGGGGGAGGCAARGGGGGGGGGGGSFGIFAVNSSIDVSDVSVKRGTGGDGGNGGSGGQGQSGGAGKAGGMRPMSVAAAGVGGDGAHGGHGGGGAGGNGGDSAGIVLSGGMLNGSLTATGGAAGKAGDGGQSAPNAPNAERDGQAGETGNAGSVSEAVTL